MAKKSNWDILSNQDVKDSVQNRDVYADQQLERGDIMQKQTPVLRIIFAVVLSLIVGVLAYFVAGFVGEVYTSVSNAGANNNGQAQQVVETVDESFPHLDFVVEDAGSSGRRYITGKGTGDEHWYESIPYLDSNGEVMATEDLTPRFKPVYGYDGTSYQSVDTGEIVKHIPKKPYEGSELAPGQSSDGETGEGDTSGSGITSGPKADMMSRIFAPSWGKLLFAFICTMGSFAIFYQIFMKNLQAQNLMSDTTDINQWHNDQHVMLPEEVHRKFDWFPDVGAHSPVQVSSMISHTMLTNKGLEKVKLSKRYDKDVLDEDGDVEYYKGEIIYDEDGNALYDVVPIIDEKFSQELYKASGAPKEVWKFYDPTKIPYNPGGKDRTKQAGKWDTVAEMINHEWTFPEYEPQRPAGAYIVDTEPVNTMVYMALCV